MSVPHSPGEIVFNTMRYRSSETVQRSEQLQLYKGPTNVLKKNNIKEKENVCKDEVLKQEKSIAK